MLGLENWSFAHVTDSKITVKHLIPFLTIYIQTLTSAHFFSCSTTEEGGLPETLEHLE